MRKPDTAAIAATETEMAARLRLSATRLARRLRREADTGFTPSQLSALATVHHHGPLTLGALADHERVAPPSITKIAAKLEADGFIERVPDADDRRVTRVATTGAGDALIAESRRRKTTWLALRIRQLDADQQARLAAALDVLDELTGQEGP
ncbi:MAG: MarR family transcriptional regulator [Acidimicrobiales bacterium]|nr:MarR family transcriptional regulator [Acidimicrobiales bacterium]